MGSDPILCWLVRFLGSRNLQEPDGRWLYAYQSTESEFTSLKDSLTQSLNERRPSTARRYTVAFDPAFALYAAEWWRRNFAGGHWAWAPILDALQITADSWPQVDRQAAVVGGLKYWLHAPGTIGLAYLGAIAAQGGLPTKVITNNGPLNSLLTRVLRRSARLNLGADDIAAVVRNDPYGLPDSLKQEEFVQLIARMIESVLRLRSEFRLAGKSDPVSELNRAHPDWRRDFPLQLEDEAANRLLELLVGEAARAPTVSIKRPVTVRRILCETVSGEWRLISVVEVQARIPVSTVASWAHSTLEHVPRVIVLDVTAGSRQLAAVASLLPGQSTEESYRAEAKLPRWEGSDACREHVLYVREGLTPIATVQVPRGEALDFEAPWIFTKSDDGWVLAACGSLKLAENEVLVTAPDGSEISGDLVEESRKTIWLAGLARVAFVATGFVKVRNTAGVVFQIRPAEVGAEEDVPSWEGHRLWIESCPDLVFLGTPRLVLHDAEGTRQVVSTKRVKWQRIHAGTSADHGLLRASLVTDGVVQRAWTMVILPADAALEFRPGNVRGGRVTLRNWGIHGAGVADGVSSTSTKIERDVTLDIEAEGTPPDEVSIHAWWDDAGAALQFKVPFPAMGVRLIDGAGKELGSRHAMSRQVLIGARLRILDPAIASQKAYSVNLSLRDNHNKVRTARHHKAIFLRNVAEYRLLDFRDEIEELFSYTDDIDAQVEIEVTRRGAIASRLLITRTDATITLEGDQLRLGGQADVQGHAIGPGDQLVAVDLSQPDRPVLHLEMKVDAESARPSWDAGPMVAVPGLWVVASPADSGLAARPTLVPVKIDGETDGESSAASPLIQAVCVADARERSGRIREVIKALAADSDNDDWEVLGAYATRLSHLPLGAFDVWRQLVRSPAMAAEFLLHQWRNKEYEQGLVVAMRFDLELPFLWESISYKDWQSAANRVRDRLLSQIGEEFAAEATAALVERRFSSAPRTVADICAVLSFNMRPDPSPETIRLATEIQAAGRNLHVSATERLWRAPGSIYQVMLQRRLDIQWPEDEKLDRVIRSSRDGYLRTFPKLEPLLVGPPELPAHRSCVVFLPVLLAIDSVTAATDGIAADVKRVLSARMMRSFDREWFEDAFIYCLRACIGLGIQDMPH